jgi:type IV secretion system protein VirB9
MFLSDLSPFFKGKQAMALAVAFSLSVAIFSPAYADNKPMRSGKDNTIKYANYHPDEVYNIYTKFGMVSVVELEADERLDGDSAALALGDATAWTLAVKGRNIIFKPNQKSPKTNLVISTNKRTYVFNLRLADKNNLTTLLRFHYPLDVAVANKQAEELRLRKQAAFNKVGTDANPIMKKNEAYFGYGNYMARQIRPTAMWDDGLFTYLEFDNAKELPAVFKVSPDGTESLVNTHVEGKKLVIQELAPTFYLRLGRAVLGIENKGYAAQAEGQFNQTGTSQADSVRLKKGGF